MPVRRGRPVRGQQIGQAKPVQLGKVSLGCLEERTAKAASGAEGGRLTLGSASGPTLALLRLPYPLLEDI